MTQNYDAKTYWDERCKEFGHVGYADELVYSYDQPLRMRAIDKAILLSAIPLRNRKVLDIGCGTGDLLVEFAKKGAEVTGIDISNEALLKAKKRLLTEKLNVTLFNVEANKIELPKNAFDLITSITVLQHIVDDEACSMAIRKIAKVAKPLGHILILETSSYKRRPLKPHIPSYIVIRSRQEYIRAFENEGCTLIREVGIPQIRIKLSQFIQNIMNEMPTHILGDFLGSELKSTGEHPSLLRFAKYSQKIILKMSWPLDYFLLPFPEKHTDLRILIFQKKRAVCE